MTKHNLVIHTIAKDEEHIINEWILHNIFIGFEHIFIYDDNSKIPILETIQVLPEYIKEKVTIFRLEDEDDFYNIDVFKTSEYYDESVYNNFTTIKQLYFQNYFLNNFKDVSELCFFCDIDEFIYLKNNDNILSFLDVYNEYDIIYIPWLVYGSSFYIEQPEGSIMKNFRYHDFKYFVLGKSICRMKNIDKIICTHEISNDKKIYKFDHNTKLHELPIHINHYQINSVKTYLKRKLRNEVGWGYGRSREVSEIYRFIINFNDNYSNIMDKYISRINDILYISNHNEIHNEKQKKNNFLSHLIMNNNYIDSFNSIEELKLILDNKSNLRYVSCNKDFPEKFNIKAYKDLNKDLYDLSDRDLYLHYLNFGRFENRKYSYENYLPDDFDATIYKLLHEDLKQFSNNDATNHYIQYGKSENRIYKLPHDFDANIYKDIYPDLQHFNEKDATYHYIQYGRFENRNYKIEDNILPNDFDATVYIGLYKDLKDFNELQAKNHYIQFGRIENRNYKIQEEEKKEEK
jgi:hypothetical protein